MVRPKKQPKLTVTRVARKAVAANLIDKAEADYLVRAHGGSPNGAQVAIEHVALLKAEIAADAVRQTLSNS